MKYSVKNKGDDDKVSQALAKMMAEDMTLKAMNDSENRQSLLYGMGDQHLEITASKLANRYKAVSYTHLDVYKSQGFGYYLLR